MQRFTRGITWLRGSLEHMFWGLLGLALLILAWHAAVVFGRLPDIVLPSPMAVVAEMARRPDLLLHNAMVTLREILIGFGLAIAVGFPIAIAISFSQPLRRIIYPLLIVSNAIPKVAIAPLFLLWLGFGETTDISIALLVAVFPIVINTTLGLTEVSQELVRLGRIMGGSRWRVFWKIRFPSALPSIFAGLKVSMSLATVGAVVGELVAGEAGLGYLTQFAAGQLQTTLVFAAIVSLSILGVLLFYAIAAIEALAIQWK